MPAVPERGALDARILEWIRDPDWRPDEARFERCARALFSFQFDHCAAYRRFCEGRGATPATLHGWQEIPRVPTGVFKEVELRCFPAESCVRTFRTSGSSASARGALHLDTLELYEASLLPAFRRHLFPDLPPGERFRTLVFAPSPAEAPESSLSHMFGVVLGELGSEASAYAVAGGGLRLESALLDLGQSVAGGEPVALCGTAFAFVHLLDELERRDLAFALPPGSRVMETGGFKGRSREIARDELYALIERRLGIPAIRCVNQYGMTELASQFYDSVLLEPNAPRRKLAPPWTRVLAVDPESGEEARPGAVGALAIVDLANTGSVLALQTADLGRRVGDGFEVLGREPGAEARGCSLAVDELLGKPPP